MRLIHGPGARTSLTLLLAGAIAGLLPATGAPALAADTVNGDAAQSSVLAARSLGQTTQLSATRVRVSGCAGVSQAMAANLKIADADPAATRRGVIVLFSGGGGTGWWGSSTNAQQAVADLQQAGFRVVQVAWDSPGWLTSASGERSGPHALACRPATLIKWVYDTMYAPLRLDPAVGVCGFCVSGNSGGASQVSYALTFYGLETILDAVVPTGGPPHAALDKGCLRRAGEEAYYYPSPGSADTIDSSYGYAAGEGPCARNDASYTDRWVAHSVEAGDVYYPATRVHLIGNGRQVGETHGQDYYAAITSPMKVNEVDPNLPHGVQNSSAGAAAIVRALTKR